MGFTEQLDEMVERIIDRAIEFYMDIHGWEIGENGNYRPQPLFAGARNDGLEITPPGTPRSAGGQVLRMAGLSGSYDGFAYGSGPNAGSLVYAHFETTIREMFQPWRSIPTPSDFDPYIDNLRTATATLSVSNNGTSVSEADNPQLAGAIEYLQKKIGGDDMDGGMIRTFDMNFCSPLPTVIQGQYTVTLLAGLTLCGEQQIWAKAREDILAISDKMNAAMKDRGAAVARDLSTVTALFNLGSVFPGPAGKAMGAVGDILPALKTLIDGGDEPSRPTVEFAAGTPDEVLGKGEEALKKLAETIRNCETAIRDTIKHAMETVTSRPGFDMAKPELLRETKIGQMKVDLDELRFLATKALPQIEKELSTAADQAFWGAMCTNEWYRPTEIGASDTTHGPQKTWAALVLLAENLLIDLAWEVKESAAHLEIAADRIGQTEAETEEALRRHARSITDSGRDPIGVASGWLNENP
uniref:hypothetical protein n=1 Tax=Amycolatopsis sp. CA-293810 TaxID=3239926 RepID=UPI003F496FBF